MGVFSKFGLGLVAVTAVLASASVARADNEAGEKAYKKYCAACHTTEAGKNRVGPSLAGIIGRTAGSVSAFAYSAANKDSGMVWTEDKLDAYLADPKAAMPGNKMTFAGIKDAAERAAVVAYLKTK
ncbi:cytochrome c [Azospirillaceae bacterium]